MTVAALAVSIEDRPPAQRLRRDLQIYAMQRDDEPVWVVKDPVSLRYYELSEAEHLLLTLLDGTQGFDEIRRKYEARFRPQRLAVRQLQGFLTQLHRMGLTVADSAGQADPLRERLSKQRVGQFLNWLATPITIRLPGFSPRTLLDVLSPFVTWMLQPVSVVLSLLGVLLITSVMLARLPELLPQMPRLESLLAGSQWVYLLLAMAGARVCHELGHAMVCRQCGADVRELGMMLLVGVPTLYCDVSDAWILPSRWQRVAIALAGVWVELLLAAVAAIVWSITVPGIVHSLAGSLILVCSVSTLLINGNPLLRYDAYYVLCDWLRISNLAERAMKELSDRVKWLVLGVEVPPRLSGNEPSRGLLLTYGVLSLAYQLFLTGLIIWVLHQAAKGWHATALVWIMVSVALVTALTRQFWSTQQEVRMLIQSRQTTSWRAALGGAILLAGLAGVLTISWDRSVRGPVVLQPEGLQPVYVSVAGRLEQGVVPGRQVAAGDLLATLSSPELEAEILTLQGRVNSQLLVVSSLEKRRNEDPLAAAELPAAVQLSSELTEQLQLRRQDQARLQINSPTSGHVIPSLVRPERLPDEGRLSVWEEQPLLPANQTCWLDRGTLLCWVGSGTHWEATVFVSQAEIEKVRVGQAAEILPLEATDNVLMGRVSRIAELDLSRAREDRQTGDTEASPLAIPENLATYTDASGERKFTDTVYQVHVRLDHAPELPLRVRSRGRARIHVGSASLGARLWEELQRTLKFRL